MSKVWKVSGICERALRKIGAFSINDSAADPEELAEAVYWLDLAVAELAGTGHCVWLVPSTLTIPLVANTKTYDLSDVLASAYPEDGILFPIEAYVRDSNDRDVPVEIIRRADYEAIEDKAQSGKPDRIYIDRLAADQNISVFPVPEDTSYSIRLVAQTYAPDFVGNNLRSSNGNIAHGLSAEWQRWMILQNAADIGSGPVRRLPPGEISEIRGAAEVARQRLMAYSNDEKDSMPRRTRAHGV